MKHAVMMLLFVAAVGSAACGGDEDVAKSIQLEPGDAAPGFSLPGSDGKTHTLAEHLGKRAVVIAWFPKAFTGG